TSLYPTSLSISLLNPIHFFSDIWQLFTNSSDPISPLYLITLPMIYPLYKSFSLKEKTIVLYSLLAIAIWYITPRTGGGRFILAYLPIMSIMVGLFLFHLQKQHEVVITKVLIGAIILTSISTIFYRGVASVKYLPYLSGKESKAAFLSSHLNFSFGDFYDTDNYFQNHIPKDRSV